LDSLTKEEEAWTQISGKIYDQTVYRSPLLLEVFEHELALARGRVTSSTCLVEVGCGTGRFCLSFAEDARLIVGVDVSRHFLDQLVNSTPHADRVVAVEGDAANLRDLLGKDDRLDEHYRQAPKLFACVMNTLGIMPESSRRRVVHEMCACLGPDDSLLLAVFNKDFFARAVREFYSVHPQLCGEIIPGDVDYGKSELHVRSTDYFSHWFSEAELCDLVESAGVVWNRISKRGPGLYLTSGPMFQE
jgi:SAM-dependent methyltransferase